jgi:hypothetical protein
MYVALLTLIRPTEAHLSEQLPKLILGASLLQHAQELH